MNKRIKFFAVSFALLSLLAVDAYPKEPPAKPSEKSEAVDPAAVKLLQGMTDHLASLNQFSVQALNLREDVSDSGHRLDFEVSAKVIISRPNKLKTERLGHLTDQVFYYDGKTLTLSSPGEKVYATESAPATIEGTIDFARDKLGIGYPVSDLVYKNAFPLLMHDVKLAAVVGKEVISGVKCDHLLFSKPGVDFQIWIAEGSPPWPRKFVVTDTGTPELLSITTFINDWNAAPAVDDSQFTFVPPEGATKISFLPLKPDAKSDR